MFVSELKGLHQTQGLIDRATNRQVVNGYLPQDAFIINDEEASEKKNQKWTLDDLHKAHLDSPFFFFK